MTTHPLNASVFYKACIMQPTQVTYCKYSHLVDFRMCVYYILYHDYERTFSHMHLPSFT